MSLTKRDSNLPATLRSAQYLEAIRSRAIAELEEQGISPESVEGKPAWKSIVAGTMLVLIDKLDTSIFTIRALLLTEIRDNHLDQTHPNDYKSPAEMFTDITGRYMSFGEYSDATAWVDLCLPVLTKMGYSEEQLNAWGTAKIRAVVPIYRVLMKDREPIATLKQSIEYVRETIKGADDLEVMKEVARLATTEGTWRDFTEALGKIPQVVKLTIEAAPGGGIINGFVTQEELEIIKRRMGRQLELEYTGGYVE